MTFSKIILSGLLVIMLTVIAEAQTKLLPAKGVKLMMEVAAENPQETLDLLLENPEDHLSEVIFNAVVVVNLFSLNQLDKIHLKLGESPGDTKLGQETFEYQTLPENTNPAENLDFYRVGKTLFFNIGRFIGDQKIHVEVVLESKTGQLSAPEYYIPFTE